VNAAVLILKIVFSARIYLHAQYLTITNVIKLSNLLPTITLESSTALVHKHLAVIQASCSRRQFVTGMAYADI
jgi:hypothetical protein